MRTNSQVFIELVTILLLFRVLAPWPEAERTTPPALKGETLTTLDTREVPSQKVILTWVLQN